MWPSPVGLPLVYQLPSILPEGKALRIQPQVEEKPIEYLVVQPSKDPYEVQDYSRRLWIC